MKKKPVKKTTKKTTKKTKAKSNKVKVIFIDASKRKIAVRSVADGHSGISSLLGGGYFAPMYRFDNQTMLLVAEDPRAMGGAFAFVGLQEWVAGNGVLVAFAEDGSTDSIDVTLVKELESAIEFR